MFYLLILLDQSYHLLVQSFMNGNARKIEGVSASKTSKFRCKITEDAKVRTQIQGISNTDLMAFQ